MKNKKKSNILFKFNLTDTNFSYNNKIIHIKGCNLDKILSVIAVYLIYKQVNKNGYVEISSNVFKSIYSNYKPYLHYLIENNCIESDNCFLYVSKNRVSSQLLFNILNKSKCFGYRFTWEFSHRVEVINTIFNLSLTNNKASNKKGIGKNSILNKNNSLESLNSNSSSISIKTETFNRLRRDFYSAQIIDFNPQKRYFDGKKYIDLGNWFLNILKLYQWKKVTKTFKIRANRLYTNFTFLSSYVRNECISLDGQKILELDIKNSFPLMLAIYCKEQNPEIIFDYDFKRYCSWVKSGIFYDEMTKVLNNNLNSDTKHREEKYRSKITEAAKLYEQTGEYVNIVDNRNVAKRKLSRNVVKELFQIYLNGDIRKSALVKGYGDSFLRKQMSNYFELIDNQINIDKQKNDILYYKLSILETSFIVSVIEELYSRFSDIKILTCHDSIYYPESYNSEVKEIWFKHLNELYNSLPGDFEYGNEDENNNDEDCFEFNNIEEDEILFDKNKNHFSPFDFD
jgi:hypothetical protein